MGREMVLFTALLFCTCSDHLCQCSCCPSPVCFSCDVCTSDDVQRAGQHLDGSTSDITVKRQRMGAASMELCSCYWRYGALNTAFRGFSWTLGCVCFVFSFKWVWWTPYDTGSRIRHLCCLFWDWKWIRNREMLWLSFLFQRSISDYMSLCESVQWTLQE